MIEHTYNLKDLKQIGTPTDEKIYIEEQVYKRLHTQEEFDKRVFVFMGHTECEEGKYKTFIESVIPVRDAQYANNVPIWDTKMWAEVFREVKRAYEESIIVGWALDIKGFTPCLTEKIEAVHLEQFGGVHQLLFLFDSMESEGFFYAQKGGHLQKKDGFYIYHDDTKKRKSDIDVHIQIENAQSKILHRNLETVTEAEGMPVVTDSIHEQMEESFLKEEQVAQEIAEIDNKKTESEEKPFNVSSYALVAAVALLSSILGLGIYQNKITLPKFGEVISSMSNATKVESRMDTEEIPSSEMPVDTQTMQDLIPIEELSADDIVEKTDMEDSEATQTMRQDETNLQDEANLQDEVDMETDSEAEYTLEEKIETEMDEEVEPVSTDSYEIYVVNKGDTLTAISKKRYGTISKIERIAEINQLENTDDIKEGQKLLLP